MNDEQQHKKRARSGHGQRKRTRSEEETSKCKKQVQQTASKSEDKKTVTTGTSSSRAGQQQGESPFFSLCSSTPMTQHITGPPLPYSDNDSVESVGSVDSTAMLMLC
jgi:hypothetical protein